MVSAAEILGLCGATLLWAWCVLLACHMLNGRLGGRIRAAVQQRIFLAALAAAWLVPLPVGNLIWFLRGVLGDLSLTTQVLLLTDVWRLRLAAFDAGADSREPDDANGSRAAALLRPLACGPALVVAAVCLVLYASALGWLRVDVYALGYEPRGLLLAVAVTLPLAWCFQPNLAIGMLAGVFAFALHALASPNLWDYLCDPILLATALVSSCPAPTARRPVPGCCRSGPARTADPTGD